MTGFDAPAASGTGLPLAQHDEDEDDLQLGLAGLAGLVSGAQPVDDLLARVAEFARQAIPGVDGAGVTLLVEDAGTTRIQAWSVTAPFVRQLDILQYEVLDEGPCLTSMRSGCPLISNSLRDDPRWPRFGRRAARLGAHSSLSLPLLLPGTPRRVVGGINAYSHRAGTFDDHALHLGEQFAGPAAVSVYNTQILTTARDRADQLQTALRSRAIIDQAIGVLRSRSGGTADEAFGRLRQISQTENAKVAVIAQRIVDEAVRRAHARNSGS